jgi:hypothetical protein
MDLRCRCLVLLALGVFAAPSSAQTVHRCRNGDTWAFQDRPCSGAQTDAGLHRIRTSAPSETPPAVQDLLVQAQANAERERRAAALQPAPAEAPPVQAPAMAYRCTVGRGFNERHFYRSTPCPEMLETQVMYVTREIDRDRSYTEAVPIFEKTTEKVMSARQACEERRAQIDPYEREKTPNRCR